MLSEGRIPLESVEQAALEKLLAEHADETISITRRDPGETGPLHVHIGDRTWEIDGRGQAHELGEP